MVYPYWQQLFQGVSEDGSLPSLSIAEPLTRDAGGRSNLGPSACKTLCFATELWTVLYSHYPISFPRVLWPCALGLLFEGIYSSPFCKIIVRATFQSVRLEGILRRHLSSPLRKRAVRVGESVSKLDFLFCAVGVHLPLLPAPKFHDIFLSL